MEFGSCRLNMFLAVLCAFSLLLSNTVNAETPAKENHKQDQELQKRSGDAEQKNDSLTRRQDNGFDFMKYFMGNSAQAQQNQQQVNQGQQQTQLRQAQQPVSIQQQHQLQQQQLAQQQQNQQAQLQLLQQQQLLQAIQQQQQQAARSNEVYQDNTAQPQQQVVALNRQGGYGPVGIGGGYQQQPKQIGISIGGGKPPNVVQVGNILTLLPRILNILSGGGKVMFGVELGNNFYFGPVGAKPLYG